MPNGNYVSTEIGTVTGLVSGDTVTIAIRGSGLVNQFQTLSMQAQGTWDTADITFQISNDNTNWYNALDSAGNPIQLTADGVAILLSNNVAGSFPFGRLVVANGGGSEDLTVTVVGGAN